MCFNSRSSCEERQKLQLLKVGIFSFNSRSSCEERPVPFFLVTVEFVFQLTLLMRGATNKLCHLIELIMVSTHAPHARSDYSSWSKCVSSSFQLTLLMRGATVADSVASTSIIVSTHAPHARSDRFREGRSSLPYRFQLTLLMRGATAQV